MTSFHQGTDISRKLLSVFIFFNIIESTLRYCSHNLVGHWILDANHLKDPHQTSDQQLWLGPCVCSLYCLSEGKSSKIMIQVHTINPYVQSICNTYTWIDYMTHPPPIKIYMRKKKKKTRNSSHCQFFAFLKFLKNYTVLLIN